MDSLQGFERGIAQTEDFAWVRSFPEANESNGSGPARTLLEALHALAAGDESRAIRTLAPLTADSTDFGRHARRILLNLHMQNGEAYPFTTAERALLDPDDAALAEALIGVGKQSFHFHQEKVALEWASNMVGLPIVSATLNGREVRLLVDTGANFTTIASDVARKAGIPTTVGGVSNVTTVTSKTVFVGVGKIGKLGFGPGLEIANHPTLTVERSALEPKIFGFIKLVRLDGILGWNALRNLRTTFDKAGKQIVFAKPQATGEGKEGHARRNLLWLGEPLVRTQTRDGKRVLMFLDTGAHRTTFTPNILGKAAIGSGQRRLRDVGGLGGFEKRSEEKAKPLTLQVSGKSLELDGARIRYGHDANEESLFVDYDGTFGIDLAKHGSLTLDALAGTFTVGGE